MSAKQAVAWLFVAGLVAASCGGSGDGGGDAADGERRRDRGRGQPVDFFGEEDSGIGARLADARAESPDGLLPTDVALDLFASIYGEVPGGQARFDEVRPHDGSLAIKAVGARWDELDDETRSAIQERLAAGDVVASDTLDAPAGFGRAVGGVDEEILALWSRANALSDEISQHLEFKRRKPINVSIVAPETFQRPAGGDATPLRDGRFVTAGDYDSCRIRLNEDVEHTDTLLAHEVFHCYQFELNSLERHFSRPDWMEEGSAAWAAVTVAGADGAHRAVFRDFQQSQESLYLTDYEAMGYFFTVETTGIDPWDDIPRMLSASTPSDRTHHPELDPMQLVSRMGTGAFLSSTDGASVDGIWDLTPQAVPRELRTSRTVSTSSPVFGSGRAPEFSTTYAQQINVDGDALDVELAGEVGAIQEVGGELETFQGEFEGRFCFEDGDARIVFMNLAFVDSGPVSIKFSVPNDDDACEEEEADGPLCPLVAIPDPGFGTLVESSETRDCPDDGGAAIAGYRRYFTPGPGELIIDWLVRTARGFDDVDGEEEDCYDDGACNRFMEDLAGGSAYLRGVFTSRGLCGDPDRSEWSASVTGELIVPVNQHDELHVQVSGGHYGGGCDSQGAAGQLFAAARTVLSSAGI